MANNELTHWGIKGMKWGIRRFQNKDGSLTSEGRKRYGDDDDNGRSKSSAPERKSARDMSDEELFRAVNRARLEDQYNSLRPEHVSTGKKFVKSTWNNVIAPAATNAGRKFLENALNKFGDDLLKDVVDPDSISELTKTRDKLKLKKEIDDLKTGKKEESWDDKIKRQTYEKNEIQIENLRNNLGQKNKNQEEPEKAKPRDDEPNKEKNVETTITKDSPVEKTTKSVVDDLADNAVSDVSDETVSKGRDFYSFFIRKE